MSRGNRCRREVRKILVSKKRFEALEKKVADLEKQVQSQPLEIINALCGLRNDQMSKANLPRHLKK